jgi:hypothetical protein
VSTLNVDKVDPNTGTALELGTSGDTITVPTGAGLTVVDEVKTNKISPATGTAFTLGDSGDTFTVPSGVTIANSGTATGFGITQTSFLPNSQSMIINGDMQVNQRATSSTSISSGDDGYHTADRWYFTTANQSSVWTQTTEALTSGDALEDGFSKSLKLDVTTADASPTASARLNLRYSFEGQDVQLIKKGTASAEKITVAFWIKATKTGTNILELYDESTTNRHCSAAYTVSSTNTWEHKIVTFPADTGGTVLANTNAQTLDLYFWVAAGSNYTSGTLQTTWINYSSGSTRDDRAVGQVNNADSTSNNFEITGVQLEVGEYTAADLPPFRHENYGTNLARCERYYQVISKKRSSYVNEVMPLVQYDSDQFYGVFNFRTVMRTPPTLESASGTDYFTFYRGGSTDNFDDFSLDKSSVYSVSLYNAPDISGTGGQGGWARWLSGAPTDSLVALKAEM